MGSTVSLPTSFRITMGMLVTGSIMRPRIFISTSICPLYHHFAQQAVGKTACNPHGGVAANHGVRSVRSGRKVQHLILGGATAPLIADFISAFNHHFNNVSDMALIPPFLDIALALHENSQTTGFLLIGNGVLQS